MRFMGFFGLSLALLSVESSLGRWLGLEVTRLDVGLALVVYVAVHSAAVEGGFIAFALGYLLDVFSGRPTGLYPALSMVVFLATRAVGQLVDGRARPMFALLVAGSVPAHALLAALLSWLTSPSGAVVAWSLSGVPLQAAASAGAGLALFPLLRRLEPGERRDPGVIS